MGTPKSSILIGFSTINHPAIGVPPWLWKPPSHENLGIEAVKLGHEMSTRNLHRNLGVNQPIRGLNLLPQLAKVQHISPSTSSTVWLLINKQIGGCCTNNHHYSTQECMRENWHTASNIQRFCF